jgi:hypothetical protein
VRECALYIAHHYFGQYEFACFNDVRCYTTHIGQYSLDNKQHNASAESRENINIFILFYRIV